MALGALLCVLSLATAERYRGIRIQFRKDFPLSDLAKAGPAVRHKFEEDLADQLGRVLEVDATRLEVKAVDVRSRIVDVAVRESMTVKEPSPEVLAEFLDAHRQDTGSLMWELSVTSHVDSGGSIELFNLRTPSSASKWFSFRDSGSMLRVDSQDSRSEDWDPEGMDILEYDLLYDAFLASKHKISDYVVNEILNDYSFPMVSKVTWMIIAFSTVTFLFSFCHHFWPGYEYHAGGIRIDRRSSRNGPGAGSPYKAEIDFYTPPPSSSRTDDNARRRKPPRPSPHALRF